MYLEDRTPPVRVNWKTDLAGSFRVFNGENLLNLSLTGRFKQAIPVSVYVLFAQDRPVAGHTRAVGNANIADFIYQG